MDDLPWHTDYSYKDPPPRYFALHVPQPDRCGGGTLSVMNVERLSELLPLAARVSLARPEILIRTPPEFTKHASQKHIVGSILLADEEGRLNMMCFREDLLTPLTSQGAETNPAGRRSEMPLDLAPYSRGPSRAVHPQ